MSDRPPERRLMTVPGRDLLPKIADAIGLDVHEVRSITIDIDLDDFVVVHVKFLANEEHAEQLTQVFARERLAPPHTLVGGAYVDLYDCEKYVEYIDRHGSLAERPARLLMDAYLASGRPQRCRELALPRLDNIREDGQPQQFRGSFDA